VTQEGKDEADEHDKAYRWLQRAIGYVGLFLPLVLLFGGFVRGSFRPIASISGYYHSDLRDLFVGSLGLLGIFFLSYRYKHGTAVVDARPDRWAANAAGWGALIAALIPTDVDRDRDPNSLPIPEVSPTILPPHDWLPTVHLFAAGLFLASLAYMSLFRFTLLPANASDITAAKRLRNEIFRRCGWTIVVCLAGCGCVFFVEGVLEWKTGFAIAFFETIAVWAFAFAWFTKGAGWSKAGPFKHLRD